MRSRNGSGSRYSDHLSHSEADDVMHAAGSRGFAMGASNNGYARFGASAYAEEQAREERRTFRCAGCTLFAGFVLIVAGLSVMYSADYGGTKARVVDGYDEIVDAWTNTYSEPFAATTFEVVFGDRDDGCAGSRDAPRHPHRPRQRARARLLPHGVRGHEPARAGGAPRDARERNDASPRRRVGRRLRGFLAYFGDRARHASFDP
jgi:hypothetical protein